MQNSLAVDKVIQIEVLAHAELERYVLENEKLREENGLFKNTLNECFKKLLCKYDCMHTRYARLDLDMREAQGVIWELNKKIERLNEQVYKAV